MPNPPTSDSARKEEARSIARIESKLPQELADIRQFVRSEYGHGKLPFEAMMRVAFKFDLTYEAACAAVQGRSVENVLGY